MIPEDFLVQKPQNYSTLYIDMDAFFASVEQYYQPELQGRPVGVATGTSLGASIIASSYQAKAAGITTGLKVEDALRICPELCIVYDSPNSYRLLHREIMQFLHTTFCQVTPKSIDEAYLKVPSYAQDEVSILALIEEIKSYFIKKYNEHITCSLGIAPNIWLAKMAATQNKPNGQKILTTKNLTQLYNLTELTRLTGVGPGMYRQLTDKGIYTTLQLYNTSWRRLTSYFGVNGQKWYLRMHGFETDIFVQKQQKSLSHQVTINHIGSNYRKKITTLLILIAEELERRLVHKKLYARSIAITIYYSDRTKWFNKIDNVESFQKSNTIYTFIKLLLKKLEKYELAKKIVVATYSLTPFYQSQIHGLQSFTAHIPISKSATSMAKELSVDTSQRAYAYFESPKQLHKVGFSGDLLKEKYKY